MEDLGTARRYHCARCRQPVLICSRCDRGNIYCFDGCAEAAYNERRRRNSQGYQRSAKGRLKNKERQRRSRLAKALKELNAQANKQPDETSTPPPAQPDSKEVNPPIITHRGSFDVPDGAPLMSVPQQPRVVTCNACQRVCSEAMRIDFLRTSRYRSRHHTHSRAPP